MVRALREEILGPSRTGRLVDCRQPLSFTTEESFYGPSIQAGSLNEIVKGESPTRRYGAGVLYPAERRTEALVDPENGGAVGGAPSNETLAGDPVITEEANKALEKMVDRSGGASGEGDETSIALANQLRPASMAVSFLADLKPKQRLMVVFKGGRYSKTSATLYDGSRIHRAQTWWLRSLLVINATFDCSEILQSSGVVRPLAVVARNAAGILIECTIHSRPVPAIAAGDHKGRLLTVSIVNRSKTDGEGEGADSVTGIDERCVFQAEFSVTGSGTPFVLPYPEKLISERDAEEKSLDLLYRHFQTFATGHGCAADWTFKGGDTERAVRVKGVPFPTIQVPRISPDVFRADGSQIMVDMRPLAGLVEGNDGLEAAREVVTAYQGWIEKRAAELASLDPKHLDAAKAHLSACRRCGQRMQDGLDLLKKDATVARAFQLANHAVLLQQEKSVRSSRRMTFDSAAARIAFEPPQPQVAGKGHWRPFQLAFLLMCLKSASDGRDPDRDVVELIWFPTGGGKTEAYLGLTAFGLFHRRIKNPNDFGTHVLMRYTLRLLTAQQFQRASALICAMEHLRKKPVNSGLGEKPFSIGIWLGGDTTPNNNKKARESYREVLGGNDEEYNFVLLRCPWCGVEMGPVKTASSGYRPKASRSNRPAAGAPNLLGVSQRGDAIVLHCPDTGNCEFAHALPICVVDEEMYKAPPDVVIGTIDKFAGLAWNPAARSFFGFDSTGARVRTPPGIVIQDELHLITGPLGSMSGLYETLVEELCTDRRTNPPTKPKIVGSTATTRAYARQIEALYNRKASYLFPPPGLHAGDSFFAAYAKKDGKLAPGPVYVGINAPSYPSGLTTNVRVFASLLQAARLLPDGPERDPWWTLLVFFNSLRELGNALTLFQGDIPERIREVARRCLPPPAAAGPAQRMVRYIGNPLELTSRISSSEVPQAISALEQEYSPQNPAVDVCLASNIIEVGVDIDRLSLMAVTGQPKTTAQYIQVTGRVGRRPDRPGLIAMVYSTSKPRDRSHFERFRSYHERLYAQVEPSSVTPFTAPVLERALHAIMVGYVRQTGDQSKTQTPAPAPVVAIDEIRKIIEARAATVDPASAAIVKEILDLRIREWFAWKRDRWDPSGDMQNPSLLRYTSGYYTPKWQDFSWPTPSSMRTVDAECRPEISILYQKKAAELAPDSPAP
jgi:hypothetical protein